MQDISRQSLKPAQATSLDTTMSKILSIALAILTLGTATLATTSCSDGETYADMKKKEKKAIMRFVADNDIVGKITEISESQFLAQDSTTDVSKNEFVRFDDDGIYMQIVRKGEGQNMIEMAKEQSDSTVSKTILCRFYEYDIESADTTASNIYSSNIVDKMLCTYYHRGRSYSASFTEGYMKSKYNAVVPEGWLKPLDYIRLTRDASKIAKVRLIVPHSSGTSNASLYVLPKYYEITYQLGR